MPIKIMKNKSGICGGVIINGGEHAFVS